MVQLLVFGYLFHVSYLSRPYLEAVQRSDVYLGTPPSVLFRAIY